MGGKGEKISSKEKFLK